MKHLALITTIFCCSFLNYSFSQNNIDLSVELNAARYTKALGIFTKPYAYPYQFSWVNGFEMAYRISDNHDISLGLLRSNASYKYSTGIAPVATDIQGTEINLGWAYNPNRNSRFSLSYGLELFSAINKLEGFYNTDVPPYRYTINHRRVYAGVAPELKLNLKIFSNLKIVAGSRFKIGRMYTTGIESEDNDHELFWNTQKWIALFEPVSIVGLRFEM